MAENKYNSMFPVEAKPDFPAKERSLLEKWEKKGLVEKYLRKNNSAKQVFSFLDGPITANNPMGVHHAWGRTYKDLFQRFNTMRGFRQRYQNGFDAQGLWVEVEVEKELGFKTKKDIETYGVAKFVQKCKSRVKKYAAVQTEQSKRFGYFMDWKRSYNTMSDENNYMIWHFLKVCHENGWLYRGNDSVPWCPRCETAISQHEMLTEDYKEVTHESIYIAFPVIGKPDHYFLVWTTTPWTIPANIALAVDSSLEYVLVRARNGLYYWVAKDVVNRVFSKGYKSIVKTVKGGKLEGLSYRGPFDNLPNVKKVAIKHPGTFHKIIKTDDRIMPINTSEGTGIVHTAVSAGTEDYKLGQKLGLPMIPVIGDDAAYLNGMGGLSGKNAKTNPRLILDHLEKMHDPDRQAWVYAIEDYTHRYPCCWRCKEELVWKVTDEWYIAMDRTCEPEDKSSDFTKEGSAETLREKMIASSKNITWIPSFGLERELDWLTNMHDWLISKKNRYWGLALPIWECKTCKSFEVIGSREELEKKAVKGWKQFEGRSPHKPYIDNVTLKCSKCKGEMLRIEPVGNPWLDAGIVSFSTIAKNNQGAPLYIKDKKAWREWFPADLITESFPGQFKNWFYSLIAMAAVLEGERPTKTILGFATLLAEDGRPMHKSWGNAIEFNEGADKIGVDVMRWMYARQNPERNLLFGYKKADETRREFHLLLWNSYRYFVTQALVSDWKPKKRRVTKTVLDKWILERLNQTIFGVTYYLKKYDAFHASGMLQDFVSDLSTWYIRRSRERKDKDAVLTVLHQTFVILSRLLAPFIPFISEEIYTNITGEESVHLTTYPKMAKSYTPDNQSLDNMQLVRKICELGHKERKKAEIKVRQPLSCLAVANVPILANRKELQEYEMLIKEELNVKNISWVKEEGELKVRLDTKITKKLKKEGEARDFVRAVQILRKKQGCELNDTIIVVAPHWPKEHEDYIKEKTLATRLKKGSALQIKINT